MDEKIIIKILEKAANEGVNDDRLISLVESISHRESRSRPVAVAMSYAIKNGAPFRVVEERAPYFVIRHNIKIPDVKVKIFVPHGFNIIVPADSRNVHILTAQGGYKNVIEVSYLDLDLSHELREVVIQKGKEAKERVKKYLNIDELSPRLLGYMEVFEGIREDVILIDSIINYIARRER